MLEINVRKLLRSPNEYLKAGVFILNKKSEQFKVSIELLSAPTSTFAPPQKTEVKCLKCNDYGAVHADIPSRAYVCDCEAGKGWKLDLKNTVSFLAPSATKDERPFCTIDHSKQPPGHIMCGGRHEEEDKILKEYIKSHPF